MDGLERGSSSFSVAGSEAPGWLICDKVVHYHAVLLHATEFGILNVSSLRRVAVAEKCQGRVTQIL